MCAQPTIGQTLPPCQWLLGGRAVYIFVASFPILEFGWNPLEPDRPGTDKRAVFRDLEMKR
jgi:hypothetical protein